MSRVLVTGANGFIGSHLIEALLKQGDTVHCLVRPGSNLSWLPQEKLTFFFGDLVTGQGLDEALQNIAIVYHLAGTTKALHKDDYFEINTAATRRLLLQIRKSSPNLSRFVFLSSLAASGPALPDRLLRESDPCRPLTHYGASKVAAEKLLTEFPGIPSVCLRAVPVYGPRDKDVLTLIRSFNRGIAPVMGRIEKQLTFIHIHDLVQALLLAADRDIAIGKTYFVSDCHVYSWPETKRAIENALHRKSVNVRIPLFIIWFFSACADLWSRFSGIPAILNLNRYREFVENNWGCSSDRIQQDLDFRPAHNLATGMKHTVQWARKMKQFTF